MMAVMHPEPSVSPATATDSNVMKQLTTQSMFDQFWGGIVDDDPADAEVFLVSLKRLGLQGVNTATEPLYLPDRNYGIILVDMNYHGQWRGPEYCRQLSIRFPHSMILAFSSYPIAEVFQSAMESGAHAAIPKGEATPLRVKQLFNSFLKRR